MVINDGSGGPEPRPESLLEPTLDTEAHLGKAKAPKSIREVMRFTGLLGTYLKLFYLHLNARRVVIIPIDRHYSLWHVPIE